METNRGIVGFLPCGGRGARLLPPIPKELMPVGWDNGRPVPLIEYSARAMWEAGAERFMVLGAPGKETLLARAMDRIGATYAIAFQESPQGTGHALAICEPWLRRDLTMYAMPDTIIRPNQFPAMVEAWRDLEGSNFAVDVMLALFDTGEPEHYGTFGVDPFPVAWLPVSLVEHREKASFKQGGFPLMWGAALLSPAAVELAAAAWRDGSWRPHAKNRQVISGRGGDEFTIDDLFDLGIAAGLGMWGVRVAGTYLDAGTEAGYRAALRMVMEEAPA